MATNKRPDHMHTAVVSVMDVLNAGAILLESDGRISHANDRVCRTFGRSLASLVGRPLRSLYESHTDALDRVGKELRREGAFEGELFLPLPDGGEMPIMISGRTLPAESQLAGHHLVMFVDISKQKQAEQRALNQQGEISRLSDVLIEQALDLKHQASKLTERVRERTAELHEANMEAIYMLAIASEARDTDTGEHVLRIQRYTHALATQLGLDEDAVDRFAYSAILHDVGKIHIPDDVLKKPGALNFDQRTLMQTHTVAGHRILSKKRFFHAARQIARSHHERWDGTGYPDRLAGESIPIAARIVSLADVYDALTHERCYKPAWSPDDAAQCIVDGRGKHFDPRVVDAFERLFARNTLQQIALDHHAARTAPPAS